MKNHMKYQALLPVYLLILLLIVTVAVVGGNVALTMSENVPLKDRRCIIIDAGHGGEDGGAVSCTGVRESDLNLDISLKLNDLLHLLGFDTYMIRTTDQSIYVQGNTIAARKVSDLKERVRIVNGIEDGILLSIHQNQFAESKYSGAQVFYNNNDRSKELALQLQHNLIYAVNPYSKRQAKKSQGVYLMEHVTRSAVLVECGFLSNAEEEAKLRSAEYQKKLCCAIAATISEFSNT